MDSRWSLRDWLGAIRCRLGGFRNRYMVEPGLYAIGRPDSGSDLFVSANYRLSFNHLRRSLEGRSGYILVLDTKGINVWCAAGKGTFGTGELIRRIRQTGVERVVSHRRLIVPQLGGPGVNGRAVRKATGFRVLFGPIRAEDLPSYLDAGYRATREMRTVTFGFVERAILTPMEMRPALRFFLSFAIFIFVAESIHPDWRNLHETWIRSLPYLGAGLISLLSGALATPLLLPYLPFRSFALKGWITGTAATLLFLFARGGSWMGSMGNGFLSASYLLLFPGFSSYLALQFTGSTVYTGQTGVKRELRFALPLYGIFAAASLLFYVAYRIVMW